jgi:galactoside alpha-1,3-fucosyltransferase 7
MTYITYFIALMMIKLHVTLLSSPQYARAMPTTTTNVTMTMLFWSPSLYGVVPPVIHTPLGDCVTSSDQNTIATADIVVFFMKSHPKPTPIARPPGALWVFCLRESPVRARDRFYDFLRVMNSQINVYMSYSTKADVYYPYGRYESIASGGKNSYDTHFRTRGGLAVAIISNCESPHRSHKIQLLREHMPIDVMGSSSCANKPLIPECKSGHQSTKDQQACFKALAGKYKFYVAIENSDCNDYITEKAWRNALAAGLERYDS